MEDQQKLMHCNSHAQNDRSDGQKQLFAHRHFQAHLHCQRHCIGSLSFPHHHHGCRDLNSRVNHLLLLLACRQTGQSASTIFIIIVHLKKIQNTNMSRSKEFLHHTRPSFLQRICLYIQRHGRGESVSDVLRQLL